MSRLKELLGKRIKEIRQSRGLTQEQLAEMLEIGTTSLSKIECGLYHPSDENIEKLASALNVFPSELYTFENWKSTAEIRHDVIDMINSANDEKVRLIYKIMRSILI